MAFFIVPFLGLLIAFLFSRIGIRIILGITLIISVAFGALVLMIAIYSAFLPDHLAHLMQILESRYENPHHRLRDFFAHFFPWSY